MKNRKKFMIIGFIILTILTVATQVFVKQNKNKNDEIQMREYSVTRGDILVGLDGYGSLKLEGESQKFTEEVSIEENYVAIGDMVKKDQNLSKVSIESIDFKLDKLKIEESKIQNVINQNENSKQIQNENTNNSWQSKVNASRNSYEIQKSKLDSDVQSIVNQISIVEQRIKELEELIEKEPSSDPDVELTSTVDELKKELEEKKILRDELNQSLDAKNKEVIQLNDQRQREINEENRLKSEQDSVSNKTNQNFDLTTQSSQKDLNKIQEEINRLNKLKKNPYLKASSDGVVLSNDYIEGKNVDLTSQGIFIGDPSNQYITASVEQDIIVQLEEGQKVEARFTAYGDLVFTGQIVKKELVGKNKNGTILFDVKVQLDPTDKELLSEMTCVLTFISKEVKDILKLSNKAIQFENGKQYVYIKLDDGSLEKKEIKTGFSDGKVSEIVEGLSENEVVVVVEE